MGKGGIGGGGLKRRSPDVDGVAEQFSNLPSLSSAVMAEARYRLATPPKRHCGDGETVVAALDLPMLPPLQQHLQPHLGLPAIHIHQQQYSQALAAGTEPMESSPYDARGGASGHYAAPQEMMPDLPVSTHTYSNSYSNPY